MAGPWEKYGNVDYSPPGGGKMGASLTPGAAQANQPSEQDLEYMPGFKGGLMGGADPLHATPDIGARQPTALDTFGGKGMIGGALRSAEDMVNAREIASRAQKGDISGAIGMGIGTIGSMVGPREAANVGRGMEAAGRGARAAEVVRGESKAAGAAQRLRGDIGGNLEAAQFMERYITPLREAVNHKLDAIHAALEKETFFTPRDFQQHINRFKNAEAEAPQIRKLYEELHGKGALDYPKAESLRRMFEKAKYEWPEHWRQEAKALEDILDRELQTIAQGKGLGKARTEGFELYNKVNELARAGASTVKQKVGKFKMAAEGVGGLFGSDKLGGVVMHGSTGEKSILKLPKIIESRAAQIAEKLGVDPKALTTAVEGVPSKLEKAGSAITKGGQAWGGSTAMGMLLRAMGLSVPNIHEMMAKRKAEGEMDSSPSQAAPSQ